MALGRQAPGAGGRAWGTWIKSFTLAGIERPLSVLCLGTANHGSAYSREQSFALLGLFAEAGGDFLDTAHIYADWLPDGHGASGRTVGEWLRARGVREAAYRSAVMEAMYEGAKKGARTGVGARPADRGEFIRRKGGPAQCAGPF